MAGESWDPVCEIERLLSAAKETKINAAVQETRDVNHLGEIERMTAQANETASYQTMVDNGVNHRDLVPQSVGRFHRNNQGNDGAVTVYAPAPGYSTAQDPTHGVGGS